MTSSSSLAIPSTRLFWTILPKVSGCPPRRCGRSGRILLNRAHLTRLSTKIFLTRCARSMPNNRLAGDFGFSAATILSTGALSRHRVSWPSRCVIEIGLRRLSSDERFSTEIERRWCCSVQPMSIGTARERSSVCSKRTHERDGSLLCPLEGPACLLKSRPAALHPMNRRCSACPTARWGISMRLPCLRAGPNVSRSSMASLCL